MQRLVGLSIAVLLAAAPAVASAADSLEAYSPAVSTSTFDWNGFYAGVHGVASVDGATGPTIGLGVNLGVNARLEFVLVGAEVAVSGLSSAAGLEAYVQTLGRAGVAVTDDLMIYGAGGLGLDLGPAGGTDALVGAGVELALTESVSLRGQYLHGFDLTGATPKDQVSVGANFHF